MNETLKGKWVYRSFRLLSDGHIEGNPELATPWSPPGVLEVDTSSAAEITGKLTFKLLPALESAPGQPIYKFHFLLLLLQASQPGFYWLSWECRISSQIHPRRFIASTIYRTKNFQMLEKIAVCTENPSLTMMATWLY